MKTLQWFVVKQWIFLTFPACFKIPIFFSNLNSDCSDLLDLRNLKEQVKKAFCYQKLFWPFTVWIKCSSDLKIFENSWPSALNFKSFSRSLEQFFLMVGQNNFGNKIPYLTTAQAAQLKEEIHYYYNLVPLSRILLRPLSWLALSNLCFGE